MYAKQRKSKKESNEQKKNSKLLSERIVRIDSKKSQMKDLHTF